MKNLTSQVIKNEEQILEEAKKIQSLGSKLSIEKLVAIITKKEAKKTKNSRRSNKKWDERNANENVISTVKPNELGEDNKARAFAQWNR